MKAVVQRVLNASVSVGGEVKGAIDMGLLVYLGVAVGDTEEDCAWICGKLEGLRIFTDAEGLMNFSVKDVGGAVLVISQFTLLADARKGRRPGYSGAALPAEAMPLYEHCLTRLRADGFHTECGVFGADMQVTYTNDGPVTILLDSRDRRQPPGK